MAYFSWLIDYYQGYYLKSSCTVLNFSILHADDMFAVVGSFIDVILFSLFYPVKPNTFSPLSGSVHVVCREVKELE